MGALPHFLLLSTKSFKMSIGKIDKSPERFLSPGQCELYMPELDFQVGVGVQDVVLEDVAGLDGLHQAQVVGVDDWVVDKKQN